MTGLLRYRKSNSSVGRQTLGANPGCPKAEREISWSFFYTNIGTCIHSSICDLRRLFRSSHR
nr:MAG TPA: hypothetical protein [Caudoviricetes sp.]